MNLNRSVNRRSLLAAGATAIAAAGAGTFWWLKGRAPANLLQAEQVTGELPITDPESKLWQKADRLNAPLIPQQMVLPWLQKASMKELTVRALFNGQQLALLLEWVDEKSDDLESIVRFRDAVALMLPLTPGAEAPPIFMGIKDKPVYILQWKASWQKDVNEGFQGVEKSYPRWFNDGYPGHPELEKLGLKGDAVTAYYPGLASNNPISQQKRTSPVEELVAEGFGTLTSLPGQKAQGRGLFAKGRYKVSFGLPLEGAAPLVQPGQSLPVAFAVWDGGEAQRGSRKHYADWINIVLPGGAG